jgi:hypothetical protein
MLYRTALMADIRLLALPTLNRPLSEALWSGLALSGPLVRGVR